MHREPKDGNRIENWIHCFTLAQTRNEYQRVKLWKSNKAVDYAALIAAGLRNSDQ